MKNLFTLILLFASGLSFGQNINWSSFEDGSNQFGYANFGFNFGVITQVGFAKQLNTQRPVVLSLDYAMPMGKTLVDDFKVRLGMQVPLYTFGDYVLSGKIHGVNRTHQTKHVRMYGFGSELAAVFGKYKERWYLALEFGIDKSIAVHLKHADQFRENYPEISDGFFVPAGGHFFYGLRGNKSIGDHFECSLQFGAYNAQFNDEDPLIPLYTKVGLIYNFSPKNESE